MDYRKLLSDVTVLILSHNRHNCLLPALKYWNEIGVNTIVLDESENPLAVTKELPFVDYHHIKLNFAQRCEYATQFLKSTYSIVVSDDELYTPSGLLRMKQELDADQGLVSVGGMALAIWKYGPRIAGAWPYMATFEYENSGSTPIERIRLHTGEGKTPRSAFFTSNLNRTEHLIRCLNLYSHAPVIATEAISILTICAAGRSKYLKELFWIRNWNEFPKSHANWDRGLYLHNWWRSNVNTREWHTFRNKLIIAFSEFSEVSSFDEAWDMILTANEAAEPRVDIRRYKQRDWLNSYQARYFKYLIKSLMNGSSIPLGYEDVLSNMDSQGVNLNIEEIDHAVNIVKDMKPYKNWN